MGRSVLDEIKQHPLPLALIGAGVAWLLLDRDEDDYEDVRDRGRRSGLEPPETASWGSSAPPADLGGTPSFAEPAGGVPVMVRPQRSGEAPDLPSGSRPEGYEEFGYGEGEQGEQSRIRAALAGAGEAASSAARRTGHGVKSAARSVRDATARTADRMSHGMHRARERSGAWLGEARLMAHDARVRVKDTADDYPLATGLAALATGMLVGLLVPGTRREDEWMGAQSDELKRSLKDKGEELAKQGKHVARRAGEIADREGISPSQLTEKFRDVVIETKQTAKQSLKEHELAPQQVSEKLRHVAAEAKEAASRETGARPEHRA